MWSRFQTGSNMPFAKRSARMFSTDSLPRKWSIRKTCRSAKAECRTLFSSRADATSHPNGFSTITRARVDRPFGGELLDHALERRGRDRQVEEAPRPAADLVLGTRHDLGHVVVVGAEDAVAEVHPVRRRATRLGPNICSESSAVARISSSDSVPRETPTIR